MILWDVLLSCGCVITTNYRVGGFGPESKCPVHGNQKNEEIKRRDDDGYA